jgi:flavin-dependent dehydrogenase
MTRTVKLAVVGTGLAGLTAAHLLKRPLALEGASADVEFEVHVFEKVRFS